MQRNYIRRAFLGSRCALRYQYAIQNRSTSPAPQLALLLLSSGRWSRCFRGIVEQAVNNERLRLR